MSSYQENIINYLSESYDEYSIIIGDNYNNSSEFLKHRANQFIGKQICEIRDNNSLKLNVYLYGGSERNSRNCRKEDFEYIIKRKIINVIH